MTNKRNYYRIEYPLGDQPTFICSLGKFKVLDVSEGGFSFSYAKITPPFEGEELEGDIQFGSRGKVTIKGVVVRVTGEQVSVRLLEQHKVPLPRIMEEQRYLIQKYPR